MYRLHRSTPQDRTDSLLQAFVDLPLEAPIEPVDYGTSWDSVFAYELEMLGERVNDDHSSRRSIADAWATPLPVTRLCPFVLAVFFRFVQETGIAAEFPFGFFYTMAGWLAHPDLHASFTPDRPDRKSYPRISNVLVADVNSGKSPHYESFVKTVFLGNPIVSPLVVSHAVLVFQTGTKKGLLVCEPNQADFAMRMHATQGRLFWTGPEAVGLMDYLFASGKTREPSKSHVDWLKLLEVQSAGQYGPTSIKSSEEEILVPRTNVGIFLTGQAKIIHEFWGATFTSGCPLRGVGLEVRPVYTFAARQDEDLHTRPFVSAIPAIHFARALWASILVNVGQVQDAKGLATKPILPNASSRTGLA